MENKDLIGAGYPNESSYRHGHNAKAEGLRILAEIILLVVGIVLLAWFAGAAFDRYLNSRAALKNFDSFSEISGSSKGAVPTEQRLEPSSAGEPDFKDWNEGRVRAYKRAASPEANTAIAVLKIDGIHLVAPVMEGTDSWTLNHAVGRIAGTARPGEEGNIGLAAHRDGFFRGLKNIRPGEMIALRTRSGEDTYRVDRTQIVTSGDVSVLRPQSVSALTLVTCYPFYFIGSAPKRFVVTAYLTQHTPAGQTTSHARVN